MDVKAINSERSVELTLNEDSKLLEARMNTFEAFSYEAAKNIYDGIVGRIATREQQLQEMEQTRKEMESVADSAKLKQLRKEIEHMQKLMALEAFDSQKEEMLKSLENDKLERDRMRPHIEKMFPDKAIQ